MKPGFALSLSAEGIVLLHRAAGGWRNVGLVPLDSPDLPTALADLRARGDTLETSGSCKLIIPNDQIRYLTIETGAADPALRREMARAALENATPYPVDDLSFDLSEDGTQTHIAAVALETLTEAESFALDNGFTPASFVAVPGEMNFLGEPFFGPAPSFTDGEIDPDGIAVVDIGPAESAFTKSTPKPQGKKRGTKSSTTQESSPKTPAAKKAVTADTAQAEQANKSVDKPTRKLSIPKAPEPQPSAEQSSSVKAPPVQATVTKTESEAGAPDVNRGPVAGFSSRRRKTTGSGPIKLRSPALDSAANAASAQIKPAPAAGPMPALAGASRSLPSAPAQAAASPVDAPETTAPIRAQNSELPATQSPAPDKSPATTEAAARAVTKPNLMAAGTAKPLPTSAKAEATTGAKKSADTLARPAETGASKVQNSGKPRHLGLILTVILLLAMAAVAAFALLSEGGIFGSPSEERQRPPIVEDAPESSPLPEDPTVVPDEAQDAPSEAPPAAIAPQVSAIPSQPDPGVVELAEQTTPKASPQSLRQADDEASTDRSVLAALDGQATQDPEALADEADLDPEQHENDLDQAALYAATGIWHTVPQIAEAPGLISLDNIYIASIDNSNLSQDAVALPPALGLATDAAPDSVSSPAAGGSAFTLDNRGLVTATPEGTLNPDGVVVYLGRPQKSPPATPARADPAIAEAETEQARLTALSSKRPRPRPADLIEQAERALLGGLSREELASVRPRARPAGLKTEEQENQPVSDLAIASSVAPRARPANFANLVDRAKRRQAAAPTATTAAAVPTIAPQTVSPSLPSSASVARQATVNNAINLRHLNLIGVYGTSANRRALIRLPSGRYKKVQVGDRIDGGTVVAIGDSQLQYQKRGTNTTLKLPGS